MDLSKAIGGPAKVHRAFLDPLGAHLALSLKPTDPEAQPDLLYLNRKLSKPKMSSKIRGNLITAIGWNAANVSEASTGPILAGTTRGVIFEAELDSGEERMIFTGGLETTWRQVFDIGKGQHAPITGLEFHTVAGGVSGPGKVIILATTNTRMYQFQGGSTGDDKPQLMNVFQRYVNVPEKFLELPAATPSTSSSGTTPSLSFFYQRMERGKSTSKVPLFPATFGWLVGAGIYAGNVDPHYDDETVTAECDLISFGGGDEVPHAYLMTEFHVLLAFDHHVRGVCILNQQTVFDCELDPGEGKIRGLARDPIYGSYYAYTDYAIHEFKVKKEERNVWKIYLEKGEFDLALQFCAGDDLRLDEVCSRQAEDLFARGLYLESAMHFAKTRRSFEEIALKFVRLEDKTALLNYLKKKLESVKGGDRAQLTMIVVWIIDTYLADMNMLKVLDEEDEARSRYDKVRREFESVLRTPKIAECVAKNRYSLYQLLGEHGARTNLIGLAEILGDYDKLVELHAQDGAYQTILNILKEQKKPTLFYRHGSVLMQAVPADFITALLEQGRRLAPAKMVPALILNAKKQQEVESVRYLEFCVAKLECTDPAIHNYLVHLYVKYNPSKLKGYIEEQGYDKEGIPYDANHALTLFQKAGLKEDAVSLHCILGQLEEAVELALDVDLETAKGCLRFASKDDLDTRKKIWLRIARYVVQQKDDIKQAMEYLQQCDGLVKIEDILPFFPDFVTIDHFKGAICDSLQDYSKHIEELRKEMEESNRAADRIRSEIASAKNEYQVVRATDTCRLCSTYLMTRPFHLFTCNHYFHTDCLTDEVAKYLSPARKRKLEELLAELARFKESDNSVGGGGGRRPMTEEVASVDSRGTAKLSKKDQLRAELDELMAGQCLYCGDLMVRQVDKPLIADADFENEMRLWM